MLCNKDRKWKVIGLSIIGLVTGCGCSKKGEKQDDIKANTNEEVVKNQTVDVFEFKNTSLIYENGETTLETSITNTSSEDQNLQEFAIQVLDKDGNEMITLTGFIGDTLKAGETRVIDSYCRDDLTNATKIVYSIKK